VKRTNASFAAAYLVLVALPLLGLAWVLRSGRTLAAPVSVGGLWRVQGDAGNAGLLPCGVFPAGGGTAFTISQSGRSFTLNVENSMMSSTWGAVEGTTLRADIVIGPKRAKQSGCDERHVLTFTATVDSGAHAKVLAGTLSVNDCSGCVPVSFRAVREERAGSRGSE
jgi:hypothetical protein